MNYLGNEMPQMILCLHEEVAVAIAHGYAKVTGKAMAAAVHSNVGLFHATMAVFNAWCDRMPVVIVGATGPVDAHKRRPWIDWIHTARDQGAIIRDYTKWDDQPASPQASREAIYRGNWIANTTPQGPVYINFDAELQEAKLTEEIKPVDPARFMPQTDTAPSAEVVKKAAAILKGAKNIVILCGRDLAQRRRLERARGVRRRAQRQGHHRAQDRRFVPDRPSEHGRDPRRQRDPAGRAGGGEERRRDRQPRLGRSRRRVQGDVRRRAAEGEGDLDHQRLPHPPRLEHGLPGPAARSTCCCR